VIPLHGGQLAAIANHFNIPAEHLLDFSANINPNGPPDGVAQAIRAALDDRSTLELYPDLELTTLRRALGTYSQVAPDHIVAANGFVPLLEAAARTLKIQSCLIPVPAFVEYRRTLERLGIRVQGFPLAPDLGFRYAAQQIVDAAIEGDHDAILLANPQNPSGVATSRDEMLQLVNLAAQSGLRILLDEAFADYTPHLSLLSQTPHTDNLVVFRSLTKFFAIPGLRVAYAAGPSAMQQMLFPWPITSLAAIGAVAALRAANYAAETLRLNRERRFRLDIALRALGFHTFASEANFLLVRLPKELPDPENFWSDLVCCEKIVVRNCANFESLGPQYLRVAIRSEVDNERLIAAMKRMLQNV
jgi:threonine-phosphate decarboxylase